MSQFKIPKSIRLMGRVITTKIVQDLASREDLIGEARYREDVINLQAINSGNHVTITKQEECFIHELVHWIFNEMGETKLRSDEKFVGLFSKLLYQALSTAKYED